MYHQIQIKGCREIKFSNGGHLFACAHQANIHVYKFYTGEHSPEMIYKSHTGPVRCLHWFDDDSGFISGGWDGNVFTHRLYSDPNKKDEGNQSTVMSKFNIKNFQFACVINKPESTEVLFATGQDKSIKMIQKGKEIERYEAGSNISQIQILH